MTDDLEKSREELIRRETKKLIAELKHYSIHLDKQKVDLVLMDIQMPVMDGMEATIKIRENKEFNNIPVIALTANAMKGDRDKYLNIGCSDYLAKPLKKSSLIKL